MAFSATGMSLLLPMMMETLVIVRTTARMRNKDLEKREGRGLG
jgi:hypothetical protein